MQQYLVYTLDFVFNTKQFNKIVKMKFDAIRSGKGLQAGKLQDAPNHNQIDHWK